MKAKPGDWIPGMVACGVLSGTLLASELVWGAAKGQPRAWLYLAAVAGLQVGGAMLAGAALGRVARSLGVAGTYAAGLWLGVESWIRMSVSMGAVFAVGAILSLAWALHRRDSSAPDWVWGLRWGTALSLAFGWWPLVSNSLAMSRSGTVASAVLVFGAVLAGFVVVARGFPALAFRDLGLAALVLLVGGGSMAGAKHILREGGKNTGTTMPVRAKGPNLIVLMLDTVAAQHMSTYGYGRETTPELTRYLTERDRSHRYRYAFAPANWTLPSHVSLWTGRIPSEHGVHYGGGRDLREAASVSWVFPNLPSLAERLTAEGYRCEGLIGNPYLSRVKGLSRGFAAFQLVQSPQILTGSGDRIRRWLLPTAFGEVGRPYATASRVADHLLTAADGCEEGGCFLFANFMDAHSPYRPQEGFRGRFGPVPGMGVEEPLLSLGPEGLAEANARYDEMIAELDAEVGRILEFLAREGLERNSWIVVTSDHGESFGGHGASGHGSSLYNDQLRIPLIVIPPIGESLPRFDGPVDLLDLTATLSAIGTGQQLGSGRDLRDPLQLATPRALAAEFFGRAMAGDEEKNGRLSSVPARAVVVENWKLIDHDERYELYHLPTDPEERLEQSAESPARVSAMTALLPPLEAGDDASVVLPLTETEAEQLRALGYLGGNPD